MLDEKDCRNKEQLQAAIHAIVVGGDDEGREVPINKIRETIREMFDERIVRNIEGYLSAHPEITHVIINIGLSHYLNTVRLIQESPSLIMEDQINGVIVSVYSEVGMANMVKSGGRRRRKSRRSRRKSRNTMRSRRGLGSRKI